MESFRVQELVLAEEIGTSGIISDVAFQAWNGETDARFYAWRMMLCRTSLDELTDSFSANYDGNEPQIVSSADPLIITCATDDWLPMPDFTGFSYDGEDNLLIEYQWLSDNSRDVYTWIWATEGCRILYNKKLEEDTGFLEATAHRLRLTFEPDIAVEEVSWGVIKAGL